MEQSVDDDDDDDDDDDVGQAKTTTDTAAIAFKVRTTHAGLFAVRPAK